MNQIAVGRFIAECRRSKNMTQNQLAEMLCTTNKSVSKWENGSCLPDASLYESLCNVLGITINELFAGHKIRNEDYQRIADENLLRMLKLRLYQLGDQRVAFAEFDNALNRMAEVTTLLKRFANRDEAVGYLVKETGLSMEECAAAYDFYMHLFDMD